MQCPYCLKEMEYGGVKIVDTSFNILNTVIWYPEKELNKKVKGKWVNLKFNAEGYYCDECMKVIAIFDEK